MVQPINYTAMMPQVDLGASLMEGLQYGAAIREMRDKRAAAEQAQLAKQQYAADLQTTLQNPTQQAWATLIAKYPGQREAFTASAEMYGKDRVQREFWQGMEISNALETGAVGTAKAKLTEIVEARKNSKEPLGLYQQMLTALDNGNVKSAQATANMVLSAIDPDNFEKASKARVAGATVGAEIEKALAAADKEVTDARVAMETAPDEIAKAKANREFEQAKAKKEEVQAKYAERNALADLKQKAAQLGLTSAQTNRVLVEAKNLVTQGKMLSLDFQAALKGLPLPSKGPSSGGTATEDERKAAGWLAQATYAYNNMLGAMYTKKGTPTGAEKPGVVETVLGTLPLIGEGSAALARSTDRQKFTQAASSLSEALLRAATGAGVNKDEAKQKLQELTPLFTDDEDTKKQKLAAIPVYLESLKSRAGRAAPSGYQVPTAPTPQLNITVDY